MFSAPAPGPGDPTAARREGPGEGWGLRRVVRTAFPAPTGPVLNALHESMLEVYLRDMLDAHGLGPAADEPSRGGESYVAMAQALLERALPRQEEADLVVLAYSIPDISPGRNLAPRSAGPVPGIRWPSRSAIRARRQRSPVCA